jgi:protease-4
MVWQAAVLGCALWGETASAQELDATRPLVPATGLATEGGPGMLWVNPANMSYDPDLRYGMFVSNSDLGAASGAPTSVALSAGAGGLGFGIQRLSSGDDADWTLDYATSLRIRKRLSAGMRVGWHIIGGGTNYVGYDLALSWRPLPWLGVSGVAANVFSPAPGLGAHARSGLGLGFRPFGPVAVIGLDYLHEFDPALPGADANRGVVSVRVRPTEGLYVRASADTSGSISAGVEVYFSGVGVGVTGGPTAAGAGGTLFIGTDDPGESLFDLGAKVPVVAVDELPPYQRATGIFARGGMTYLEMLERMRRSEEDPGVKGVVVLVGGSPLSWAKAEEVRARVVALEKAGKPVIAYVRGTASNADLYVASAARKIYMHPGQDVMLVGLDAELMFLRGAFDLVGVEPQFVRRNEYKSAVEQYTSTEPSAPSLEQTNALLDELQATLVKGISDGRRVAPDVVQRWIDAGPHSADDAVQMGLIDGVRYPDQLEDLLKEELHRNSVDVLSIDKLPTPHSGWKGTSQVAVVYITGAILPGDSSDGGLLGGGGTGAATVIRQLEQARRDEQVKAVVLRVDSPGGSSFASEEIHREIERVKKEGKPVIVSMGGAAASGGYYVACGADAIWAEPTTITGSIGVFTGKFAIGGLLERVGVHTTSLTRGRSANIDSTTAPWDEVERARMQALVDHTYLTFKQRVAEGRNLNLDEVERVARGHVWTGRKATEIGLVDRLGSLQDAVDDARARAKIPSARLQLVTYDARGTLMEQIAPEISPTGRALVTAFPALAEGASPLARLPIPKGVAELATLASRPQEVWMMLPWTLQVDGEAIAP